MARFFFFFNGKKKTQAKLASASVTTWFNQRCVCRRFHSHFLHFFFFLSFCLFSCFITRASDVFQHLAGTWQAVHLSRARPRSLPQQSQDALCQLLLYTVARTTSKKLFKCSSNQLFSGAVEVCLQPALQEKKERKYGAVKLKKRMKAEHTSPRRCIILVDGSPVTLMLWTMNAPQDDKKTCCESGLWSSKTKKRDLNFTEVRLVFHLHSSVRVSGMNVGHYCPGTPSEIRTKSSYRISL